MIEHCDQRAYPYLYILRNLVFKFEDIQIIFLCNMHHDKQTRQNKNGDRRFMLLMYFDDFDEYKNALDDELIKKERRELEYFNNLINMGLV